MAFTEHGVVMVATLLNSARAVEASQFIVEAFVEMQANPKRGSTLRDETEELIDKGLANALLNCWIAALK